METITWNDFEKVEMRVGTILEANDFPEARKPAYQLQVGQKISLKEKSRSNEMFKENFQTVVGNSYPYIEKDVDKFEAVLSRLPEREEIPIEIEDVYVVEYYSH